MIEKKYVVNNTEYDLSEAVTLIRSGKWNDAMQYIKKFCGVSDDAARAVGIKIKDSIANHKNNIEENMVQIRSSFIATTGFDVSGYSITDYHGIVGGQATLGTGLIADISSGISDMTGSGNSAIDDKVSLLRDRCYDKITRQAISAGGNAIIGLSFKYFVLSHNMLCVSAEGTAVTIKKL